MNNMERFFFDEVLKQDMIPGFPYPDKFCPYCNRQLQLARVAHIVDEPENFKALYLCLNDNCGAYDEGKQAYTRMYFSTQKAYDKLGLLLMALPRRKKR